jgi:two-component system LytT family sensor kinase
LSKVFGRSSKNAVPERIPGRRRAVLISFGSQTGSHKSFVEAGRRIVMSPALKEEFRQQRVALFGRRRYLIHILLWMLVIGMSYPYAKEFSRGFAMGTAGLPAGDTVISVAPANAVSLKSNSRKVSKQFRDAFNNRRWLIFDAVFSVALAALLVYSFLLYAIPYARFRQRKRLLFFAFIVLAALFIVTVLGISIAIGLIEGGEGRASGEKGLAAVIHMLLCAILVCVITVTFFSFYYFIDLYDQQKSLDRYRSVFAAKMQAETSFLKMQINPHFLFNSLNNIYALTLNRSPQAPVIAGRLRELVNYMLNECSQETVPVADELNFLRNYIALEQLRNTQEHVRITYEVRGEDDQLRMAPLLLVNFIENAFKHGVKAGVEPASVRVRIDIIGRALSMEVFNTKPVAVPEQSLAIRDAGGIGIRNVRRRLQILYPGRHSLKINDTAKGYSVHLNLEL